MWAIPEEDRRGKNGGGESHRALQRTVASVLLRREQQAITFSLFAQELANAGSGPIAERGLKRKISTAYTLHYMGFAGADIPTGVRGFEFFDQLSQHFPLYDVPLLLKLLKAVRLGNLLGAPWRAHEGFWAAAKEWRGSPIHAQFRSEMTLLLSSIRESVTETSLGGVPRNSYEMRHAAASMIEAAATAVGSEKGNLHAPDIDRALAILRSLFAVLAKDAAFARSMDKVLSARGDDHCDVLVVVATEIERDTFLRIAKALTGADHQILFGQRRTYFDLGYIGPSRTFLVQTEMGSVSPGASLPTVSDAIDEKKPRYVLLVGIAFGVDPDRQHIGRVLVSRQLQGYELQRVGQKKAGSALITLRGDKATASTTILGRLRAATASWRDSPVDFGLLISGEKLIDDLDYRDNLLQLIPEAIGGEMEGAGLYAACVERQIHWVVVKAICDWADGKKRIRKGPRQQLAATRAASFVVHSIAAGGFVSPPITSAR
jgi:nucleoside phosphorylase